MSNDHYLFHENSLSKRVLENQVQQGERADDALIWPIRRMRGSPRCWSVASCRSHLTPELKSDLTSDPGFTVRTGLLSFTELHFEFYTVPGLAASSVWPFCLNCWTLNEFWGTLSYWEPKRFWKEEPALVFSQFHFRREIIPVFVYVTHSHRTHKNYQMS